jgi:hypothetical protein
MINMWNNITDRKNRIKNRLKNKNNKKWLLFKFLFVLFLFLIYFIFSDNISVDKKTWKVKIVKTEKIIKEDFHNSYSWTILFGQSVDFDIDLNNVYLTWTTVDIMFSNNNEFKSYPAGSINNIEKIRYWFMLWKLRNRNKVFWLWKVTNSVNKSHFNISDLEEDWILSFKWVKLWWNWNLFVQIDINWQKIIKK